MTGIIAVASLPQTDRVPRLGFIKMGYRH